jgi:hypothetical protein
MQEACFYRHGLLFSLAESDAQNHYFGGLDQRRSALARLEAHFFGSVSGDYRRDVLFADRERDLREQTAVLDFHDTADQLVAAANFAEIDAARADVSTLQFFGNEAIDFAFGNTVVAAGRFCSADFVMVDPLFQGGIADAEDVRGFARRQ